MIPSIELGSVSAYIISSRMITINEGINIFAAFSIPFSTPLETIRAVKNINRIE